jgi:hypothetical protein
VNEESLRAVVRRRYDGRCGYCSVRESEAGTELEIDHFQPRSAGGSEDLDNLVYCCTTCNRLKGSFWPAADPAAAAKRILHPQRDDLSGHLQEDPEGRMIALTEIGVFHLNRLHLNRPPLVALRCTRREVAQLRQHVTEAQSEQVWLRERIAKLEHDLQEMAEQMARLSEP